MGTRTVSSDRAVLAADLDFDAYVVVVSPGARPDLESDSLGGDLEMPLCILMGFVTRVLVVDRDEEDRWCVADLTGLVISIGKASTLGVKMNLSFDALTGESCVNGLSLSPRPDCVGSATLFLRSFRCFFASLAHFFCFDNSAQAIPPQTRANTYCPGEYMEMAFNA